MPLLTNSYLIKLLIKSLFSFQPSSLSSEPQGPITVSRSQLSQSLIYVVRPSMHFSSIVIFLVTASGLTSAACKSHPRVFLVHLTPWSQLLERPSACSLSSIPPNILRLPLPSRTNGHPATVPGNKVKNSGVYQLCQK